jgi:hypothetical protein
MNIIYQVHGSPPSITPRCHTALLNLCFFAAYQRLVGGWDVDFDDEVKEADGDRLCKDRCLQRRMVNVSVLSKDMVTPYR